MIRIDTDLRLIKGINSKLLTRINKLGIRTVRDLLWHFPFRYEDFSTIVKISDLGINQSATIQGVIRKVNLRRTWQKRMLIVETFIEDESGMIKAVWFNQPYIARILQAGKMANFAGKVVFSQDELCLSNPIYELVSSYHAETKHTAGLIPIYSETKGLTSKGLRYLIKPILSSLEKLPDFIPPAIITSYRLPDINAALQHVHFPPKLADAERAKNRFAFEDLFLLQLHNLKLKHKLTKEKAIAISVNRAEISSIISLLPFTLTSSQRRSLEEILSDINKPQPMNRLLQGDVGSGKTVIAAIAALTVAKDGKQSAIMVPTEVLAKQHYKTFSKLFGYLAIPIGLITNSETRCAYGEQLEISVKKSEFLKKIAAGEIKIIVGTHTLIAQRVTDTVKVRARLSFNNLALVTIDEQHRFGVEQRAALTHSPTAEHYLPHFLSMSATPIPRTLTLTLFGDLDLSTITELPAGRKNIITKVVDPTNRAKAYQFIREQITKGRQAFVICPRIEIGGQMSDIRDQKSDVELRGSGINDPKPETRNQKSVGWDDVRAVKEEFERLSKNVFPDLRLAMLHGKLKAAEKNTIMSDFAENKTNILVATSVIEVGVDVPNASIMLIEGADRFGLAQLYQFRGRVGRAEHQSFCLLFTDSTATTTHQRLASLLEAKNGFELAEKDLEIRGPGEFIGHTQTGLPDLAMRSLNNVELIKTARAAAQDTLACDAVLANHSLLQKALDNFKERIHLE